MRSADERELGGSALLVVVALAGLVRLAYLSWIPAEVFGDATFYFFYATQIAQGQGFSEADGSAAIFWMPGWPLLLGALFTIVGESVRAAMLLNALLGTATAGLLAAFGARLLGRRVGLFAGLVYAVWPGNVYLGGLLLAETAFNFFLALASWLLLRVEKAERPERAAFAAGLGFAAAALTKAEPLILAPVFVGTLWLITPSPQARSAAMAWVAALLLALAPWVARNYEATGRLVLTSASGGTNFWIGNHHGASGGNDLDVESLYRSLHRRSTFAETNLAQNDAGWRDGLAFVRAHPAEALGLLPRKLWLTYSSDTAGLGLDRPFEPERRRSLAWVANGFWFVVLALAIAGAARARGWPPATRLFVLGLPAAWLGVHLVFVGGPRFHAPETLALALLAGVSAEAILRAAGQNGPETASGG